MSFLNLSNISSGFTNTTEDYGYLYRTLVQYFLQWYLLIVVGVGIITGLFCLLFLFMSKLFPRNILIWMVSICIADLMILLWDALRMLMKIYFHYDIRDENSPLCKSHNFFSNYFFYWSGYMQASMSLQRLYFVRQPLKARVYLPFRRVVVIWGVVTGLCALPLLPYLLYWNVHENNDCEPDDKWYYYVTTVSDLVIWGMLPLLSMTISTILISVRIFNFKADMSSGGGGRGAKRYRGNGGTSGEGVSVDSSSSSQAVTVPVIRQTVGRRHGGSDNARHVTKLLVSMNVFYMATTYPLLIYLMHLNFGLQNQVGVTIPQPVHKFYYYLLRSICYLNSSCNWLFYCAAGRVFRCRAKQILTRFFCCQRGPRAAERLYAGGGNSCYAGYSHVGRSIQLKRQYSGNTESTNIRSVHNR